MNRAAMESTSEETVYRFFEQMHSSFRCPVISNPNDYILDSGWFYDTNFHLNTAGAELRTQRFAADVLAALGCCDALNWLEPEMPAIAVTMETTLGDDAFVYTPLDGGFLISGLAKPAANSLTVPSHHDGLPVVGFTADALKTAGQLRELCIPATIGLLPDNLLNNCPHLTRLVLNHTDVPCAITTHSLDGPVDLKIYVPQNAYHLYRDGTGCGPNPWESFLKRISAY